MYLLLSGILIFFGMHLLPSFPGFRNTLVSRLGELPYRALYSVLALSGLILIIYGKSQAEFVPVWYPPDWGRYATIAIMLPAIFLLVAADMSTNLKRVMRHPMLLGVALWSTAHLLVNGDLASILLFSAFLVFALFAIYSANRRGAGYQENSVPYIKDVISIIASLLFYFVFLKYLHPFLIGVSII